MNVNISASNQEYISIMSRIVGCLPNDLINDALDKKRESDADTLNQLKAFVERLNVPKRRLDEKEAEAYAAKESRSIKALEQKKQGKIYSDNCTWEEAINAHKARSGADK